MTHKHLHDLTTVLDRTLAHFQQVTEQHQAQLGLEETGTVIQVADGVARISGLTGVQAEELLTFSDGTPGMAFNLDEDEVGVILLDDYEQIEAGASVHRTRRVFDIVVGERLLGRVIDPAGQPLDAGGRVDADESRPIERQAPAIMDRSPVSVPLQTGIKSIDALLPIGRGQRELIVGDRQTGKTAIALDTIINQGDKDVICVYCAIGQEKSAVARFIASLESYDALSYCIVVVATGDTAPGLQFSAPYAATSIAEQFMDQGRDVLIVYDDLTRHARAYRELSLLLHRPPGREAYPGDIFYIHSRLLERSTHLSEGAGGGTLTALPIVETQAQNISAYIPTNLISITDGQIYLSPRLFQKGVLPAIDIGRSVSRVGGKAQIPAYRAVAGDLRLAYSQFEELEAFARFGTRLDEATRHTIERGRRVREILKQDQYQPVPVLQQIAVMIAVTEGVFDEMPLENIRAAEQRIQKAVAEKPGDLSDKVKDGQELDADDHDNLLAVVRKAVNDMNDRDA